MRRNTLKILSIDDDLSCQRVATQFLTMVGKHIVETAYTGPDGLKKAEVINPDVILLDFGLPCMQGDEVLVELFTNPVTKNIPVIIITGCDLESREHGLYRNGNLKYIAQKPARFADILHKIEEIT